MFIWEVSEAENCPFELDVSTGQLLRTYLVQVPCIKDGKSRLREGVTRLTSQSARIMVIDFSFQRVFVFYTCRCNSWCVEAAVIQADITVLAQSENQESGVLQSNHTGCKGREEPLDNDVCFSICNISNSQTVQMKS